MTVKELKKALRGMPDNAPVYTRDHDQRDYEVNYLVREVELLNREDANEYELRNANFNIEGDYVVLGS